MDDKKARQRGYRKAWEQRNPERVRARYRKKNWQKQGGVSPTREEPARCECCGGTQVKALHLDHEHGTRTFRGWLCAKCNLGIGLLGDGAEGVARAADYLRRAEELEYLRRIHD